MYFCYRTRGGFIVYSDKSPRTKEGVIQAEKYSFNCELIQENVAIRFNRTRTKIILIETGEQCKIKANGIYETVGDAVLEFQDSERVDVYNAIMGLAGIFPAQRVLKELGYTYDDKNTHMLHYKGTMAWYKEYSKLTVVYGEPFDPIDFTLEFI